MSIIFNQPLPWIKLDSYLPVTGNRINQQYDRYSINDLYLGYGDSSDIEFEVINPFLVQRCSPYQEDYIDLLSIAIGKINKIGEYIKNTYQLSKEVSTIFETSRSYVVYSNFSPFYSGYPSGYIWSYSGIGVDNQLNNRIDDAIAGIIKPNFYGTEYMYPVPSLVFQTTDNEPFRSNSDLLASHLNQYTIVGVKVLATRTESNLEYLEDVIITNKNDVDKYPTVYSIFYGHTEADRANWFVTTNIKLTFDKDGLITYSYLQLDDSVTPHVFNRLFYSINAKKNQSIYLAVDRAVLFSFLCNFNGVNIQNQIISSAVSSNRSIDKLFIDSLDQVINNWIRNLSFDFPIDPPNVPDGITATLTASKKIVQLPLHKLYPATNTLWNNQLIIGINDIDDDKYYLGNTYVFDRYFKLDNTKLDLFNQDIMTNPYLLEIHKALEAGTYSRNELDTTENRISTLAWHLNKQSQILGIRVDANGKINEELEKTNFIRKHVNGNESNDLKEYNPNCFGSKGMLLRHLPNKFTSKGIELGGYRKIHDLPQMMAELHEQANAAIGYQQGTAIEIQIDGETYRYPNQLALLTELLVTSKQIVTYSKGAFFSSIVSEQSIKEVISGLGLRTVDRFIEFMIAGKSTRLYYKGISASQSIRRKLAAVSTNVAQVLGNII